MALEHRMNYIKVKVLRIFQCHLRIHRDHCGSSSFFTEHEFHIGTPICFIRLEKIKSFIIKTFIVTKFTSITVAETFSIK